MILTPQILSEFFHDKPKQIVLFRRRPNHSYDRFWRNGSLTYLSSLNISATSLGLVATVPPAIGALSQAAIPFVFKRRSVVSLMLCSVFLQILGLLCLALSFQEDILNIWLVGLSFTLYWIGGMSAGAPWQEWISQLVPDEEINRFFARRSAFLSLVLLLCYFIVGFYLKDRLNSQWVAASLFIALFLRVLSFATLLRHPKPAPIQQKKTSLVTISPWREQKNGLSISISLWRLSAFAFFFRLCVCISGPFFAPYMLQELNQNTLTYFSLSAIPLMVRVMFTTNWARLLDESRIFEGMVICVVGISVLPVLWNISSATSSLVIWQCLSGLVWAGFELITVIFIQRLYPHAIMRSLAIFSAASSLGNAFGGYLGGLIKDQGFDYAELFSLSTGLRFIFGLLFLAYLRRCHAFRVRELQLRKGMATVLSLKSSQEVVVKMTSKVTHTVKETIWKSS